MISANALTSIHAAAENKNLQSSKRELKCGREDSNLHGINSH